MRNDDTMAGNSAKKEFGLLKRELQSQKSGNLMYRNVIPQIIPS